MRRMTMAEVAQELDVNLRTVWRWALDGVGGRRLRTIRIGGRRFVMDVDLQSFLQDDEVGQPPQNQPPRTFRADAHRLDELLGRQPSDRRRQ